MCGAKNGILRYMPSPSKSSGKKVFNSLPTYRSFSKKVGDSPKPSSSSLKVNGNCQKSLIHNANVLVVGLMVGLGATWIAHWYVDSLISRDRTYHRATKAESTKAVKKALKSSVIFVRSDDFDPYIERKQLQSEMKIMQEIWPTVVITGPTGSGKTTFVQRYFKDEKGVVCIDISSSEHKSPTSLATESDVFELIWKKLGLNNKYISNGWPVPSYPSVVVANALCEIKDEESPPQGGKRWRPTLIFEVDSYYEPLIFENLLLTLKKIGADHGLANCVVVLSSSQSAFTLSTFHRDVSVLHGGFLVVDNFTESESIEYLQKSCVKHLHASPESCEKVCNVAKHLGTNPLTLAYLQNDMSVKIKGKSDDPLRDTLTHLNELLRDRIASSEDMVDHFAKALKSDCKDVKKSLLELVENPISLYSFEDKMKLTPNTVIQAVNNKYRHQPVIINPSDTMVYPSSHLILYWKHQNMVGNFASTIKKRAKDVSRVLQSVVKEPMTLEKFAKELSVEPKIVEEVANNSTTYPNPILIENNMVHPTCELMLYYKKRG